MALSVGLEKLFEDVGSRLTPREIKYIIQGTKRYYKSPQYSEIQDNDFKSFGELLQKHGRIGANNLGMLENVVAPSSSQRQEIEKLIEEFKRNVSKDDIPEKFVGRENDMEKIMKRLENPRVKAVSLFGPPGVGKTTLAFEAAKMFCSSRDDGAFERIDVDLKGTTNLNFHVLQAFGVKTISYELEVVRKHVNNMEKKALVVLDNVEQFLIRSRGQGRDQNFMQLLEIMMNSDKIKLLLTSREKIDEPSLRRLGLSEFEVKPLSDKLSTDMVTQRLGTPTQPVSAEALFKIVELAGNNPLLLQSILPIIKAEIKSLDDVVRDIEQKLQKEEKTADTDLEGKEFISKSKEDSCFKQMFEALNPEQQQEAIKLSLFRRAFTVTDAEKLLDKPSSIDTNLTLETLKNAKVLNIHDSTEKSVERSYEIHPRLKEFLGDLKKDRVYTKDFAKAEELFYKLFVEKISKLSELLETDFIDAFNEMEKQRPNFELTLEIAKRQSMPFLLYSDDHHEKALIFILFEAMFKVGERRNFYKSWSDIAKEKGKWLVSGQLRCWEAEQVISLEGPTKAMDVLDEAKHCLDKAKQLEPEKSCDAEESLYLYVRGVILEELEKYKEALKVLEQSLEIRKTVFKEHILTARTMNAIGNCLQRLERYDEAQKYYYETKEMRSKLTGSDKHFDMPVYYNQLATIHEVKGCNLKYSVQTKEAREQANKEFQACIDWYQKALDLEAALGVQGYGNTATFYRNMANTYMHLENYDKAFEAASKALTIRREIHVFKEHPDTAKSLYQVGIALEWRAAAANKDPELLRQALRNYKEAQRMLQNLPEDNRGEEGFQKQVEDRCTALQKYEEGREHLKTEESPKTPTEEAKEPLREAEVGQLEESIKGRKAIQDLQVSMEPSEWNTERAGVYLKFPEGSVKSATQLKLYLWSHDKRAPPIHENEALVSSVFQLAPDILFEEPVKLVLSHGAPDCKGYEVVIKQLHTESGKWIDLDTRDFQSFKEYDSPDDDLNLNFPIAEAEIKECSTFAVVYRLQTHKATFTSSGGKLCPADFDGITVVCPKNGTKTAFDLGLKVQHVPHSLMVEQETNSYSTPILQFDCPKNLKLLKPVTVSIPLTFEDNDSSHPDLDVKDLKVFYRKSIVDPDEKPPWEDRTEALDPSPKLKNGIVELQLKSFSYIWVWTGCRAVASILSVVTRVYEFVARPNLHAAFAVYQDPISPQSLTFVCFSPAQYKDLLSTMLEDRKMKQLGKSCSDYDMKKGDVVVVELDVPIDIIPERKEFTLKFWGNDYPPFDKQLDVVMDRKKSDVRFRSSARTEGVLEYCILRIKLQPHEEGPVQFYGIPLTDKILLDSRVHDISPTLAPCLQPEVYEELRLLEGNSKKYFSRLAQLLPDDQDKCFDAIICLLDKLGDGFVECRKRLSDGKKIVCSSVNEDVIAFVSRKICGGWRMLGRELGVKQTVIRNITDEVWSEGIRDPSQYEECYRVLDRWYRESGSRATVRVLLTSLTSCGNGDIAENLCKRLTLDDDGQLRLQN